MLPLVEIEPTYKSPKVLLDPRTGQFKIEGKSILEKVDEFYAPLLEWFDSFSKDPSSDKVEFTFDMGYCNIASCKRFMYFLYLIKELKSKNVGITINWIYHSKDSINMERGEDLSQAVGLPFNFIFYEKLHKKEQNLN